MAGVLAMGCSAAGVSERTAPTTVPPATMGTPPITVVSSSHDGSSTCYSNPLVLAIDHVGEYMVCVAPGTRLTIQFDKHDGGIGTPGPWTRPPVDSSPSSVLALRSSVSRGDRLVAVFDAVTPGTADVNASFDQECSGPQTTPCTIPPQAAFDVSVIVQSL